MEEFDKDRDVALPAETPIVAAYLTGRLLPSLAYNLMPNIARTYITEKTLELGYPIYRALNKTKEFGKIGTKYYKENIQPYVEHNNTFNNDYYFPGSSAGKPDYEYMSQYPKLRKNVRDAQEYIYLDNNKARTDANGFDNIKVNYKGKDYSYQFKNNAYNKRKEFHNIKPFELVENELKEKLTPNLYKYLIDE